MPLPDHRRMQRRLAEDSGTELPNMLVINDSVTVTVKFNAKMSVRWFRGAGRRT